MTDLRAPDGPGTGEILARRYRIEGLIGSGGMARVFRAEDAVLRRTVALKIFRAAGDDVVTDDRSRSETRLLASLSHASLVTLYDAHLDDDAPQFLVMEYVDGNTLRERIVAGVLPPRTVAAMASDLAEALHVVHAAGVVHRDIKPSNVLLATAHLPGREFRAKLADFGIAYLLDSTRLTMPGSVIGTAAYLAPEQVRGESPAPPADVYALGLVLIEALSGRRAFPQEVSHEAALARLVNPPAIPSTLSPPWRDLLTAMTATDAAARPTALEVAIAASALSTVPDADADPATTAAFTPGEEPTLRMPVPPLPTTPADAAVTAPVAPGEDVIPTRPAPPVVPPTPAVDASRSRTRRDHRRRALRRGWWLWAVAALVVIGGAIWGITAAQGGSGQPPQLPVVDEPLGTHLDDLLDAVTP